MSKGNFSTFSSSPLQRLVKNVEEIGVSVERAAHRYTVYNIDISFPFVIATLCLSGSSRSMYDMRELTQRKNDLALILPGHVLRPLECSDDYTYARIAISQKMFDDLRSQLFSHDYRKFNRAPICSLTDEQTRRLMMFVEQLEIIAGHDEMELRHRNHILLAELAVGYEFLNYYRREQDKQWSGNRSSVIFSQFSDLVVTHYKEEKETGFYAEKLHLHPKYLCRAVSSETHGISPKEWIANYVVAQAKRAIETQPEKSLKEIGFQIGFAEPSSFYRYFKRVAGITAKEYKESL